VWIAVNVDSRELRVQQHDEAVAAMGTAGKVKRADLERHCGEDQKRY
jgi:hypothetical protein